MALELRRLVHGDLCGMFDGPTTPGLRLDGPLVVLDLSAVYHSPALGVLMACAAAWLQSAVRARHRNRIILVVDEAWAILVQPRAWPGGSRRRGSCRGPTAWPTWPSSTGCPTSARWAPRARSRSVWPRACWPTPRPGWSTPSPRGGGPHRRAARPYRHRGRPGQPAPSGHGPLEGRPAVLPGRAPAGVGRAWLTDTDQAMAEYEPPRIRPTDPGAEVSLPTVVASAVGLSAFVGAGLLGSDRPRSGPSPAAAAPVSAPDADSPPAGVGRLPERGAAGTAARWAGTAATSGRSPVPGRSVRDRPPPGGWCSAGSGGGWWRPSRPSRSSSSAPPSPTRRRASPCRPSSNGRAGRGGQCQDRPARPHHRPPALARRGPVLRSDGVDRSGLGLVVPVAVGADLARGAPGGGRGSDRGGQDVRSAP